MRQEKQLLLNEIKGQIERFNSFVVIRYSALEANKANEFRREISKFGGDVEVMRKRILIKAAESAGVTLDLKTLPGHIGIVYTGQDPLEITKYVCKYGEDNANAISVVGGRIDGQMYSGEDVVMLAKLPGKDEMRAQLLSVFEAPMAQTLGVIDALLTSVLHCLENKCKNEEN